jgi:hypothetical protein
MCSYHRDVIVLHMQCNTIQLSSLCFISMGPYPTRYFQVVLVVLVVGGWWLVADSTEQTPKRSSSPCKLQMQCKLSYCSIVPCLTLTVL